MNSSRYEIEDQLKTLCALANAARRIMRNGYGFPIESALAAESILLELDSVTGVARENVRKYRLELEEEERAPSEPKLAEQEDGGIDVIPF